MAFTYAGTLATDLDKVRFYIGDKVANAGPRPGDGNFTDAEITGALALDDTWQETVAGMFDTLAAEWIRYPSFQADNFAISRSHIAKNYQAQAQWWRDNHGLAAPENKYGAPGSEPITRVDAYSTDKDSVTE
jgi:hypothetical protein